MTTNYNKVIWSEGMFLRHEHFQQHDRYFETLTTLAKRVEQYFFGFSELELDTDLLALGKIRLAKFAGLFADGTVFQYQINCAVLATLEVPKNTVDCIVYLCLPLKDSNRTEVNSDEFPQFLARYHIENIEATDNSMQSDTTHTISIGRLFTRLMLETHDRSQYVCLAFSKIKEVNLNGEIILDENFIPVCNNIKISTIINQFIERLYIAINNRFDDLSSRLNRPERYEKTYVTDFMLLQLLCRYQNLVLHWKQTQWLHPENLYTELLKLHGDLAVFSQNTDRLKIIIPYQHLDLQASYKKIMQSILENLLSILNQRAVQLEIIEQESGRYLIKTGEWTNLKNVEIILAIKADMPVENLQRAFINQVKIASAEHIDQLISSHLPGINGLFLSLTPPELPFHSGYSYFKLKKLTLSDDELTTSMDLIVHVGGYFPELDLTAWIIKD